MINSSSYSVILNRFQNYVFICVLGSADGSMIETRRCAAPLFHVPAGSGG